MSPWESSALATSDARHLFSDIQDQFQLSQERLSSLAQAFVDECKTGLKEYKHPMAMIPSFVTGVPDGTEKGTFLALDLGGTNLRVCAVHLNGNKTFTIRQHKYKVSDSLKVGSATALFDYLADCVDAFLTSSEFFDGLDSGPDSAKSATVHLGLTFSFPVEQSALASGVLLTWTKGFAAKGAIQKDVVKLLQDAFDRKHMHVKCVALVNDTVGTLLSRAYTAGGCALGAIFGTGTNGAYVERLANITKLKETHPEVFNAGGDMVVNCEWGAFNQSRRHLPTTPYDKTLDRLSINPGRQAFEKFISGMYLGEIMRLVLVSLVDATITLPISPTAPPKAPPALLFGGKSNAVMNEMWAIDSSFMTEVEDAWGGDRAQEEESHVGVSVAELPFDEAQLSESARKRLERVREVVVERFGYEDQDVGIWDAAVVRWVAALVARRAALLSGVPLAAILVQTGRATLRGGSAPPEAAKGEKIIVGVDGSLIEHYPGFERTLRESLRALVGEEVEKRVEIGMAKDGSGVGAALGALQGLKSPS